MRFIAGIILSVFMIIPVSANEFIAPEVPKSGQHLMPEVDNFGDGLLLILNDISKSFLPNIHEAAKVCIEISVTVILIAIAHLFSGSVKLASDMAGAVAVSATMLINTNTLINLGCDTVREITEYGKLLLPVMAGALAAQGGIGTSSALYAGTAFFSNILTRLITNLFTPCIYIYLALSVCFSVTGEGTVKQIRAFLSSGMTWVLKSILGCFTGYMSLTGVISGTTDSATLKATKTIISTVVPVVGKILSDASDTILISAELAKNTAGIYGMLAIVAIFMGPFVRIGCHYIMLKLTYAICKIYGTQSIAGLIGDFSTTMGLLLGITGSVCVIQLISTVCFLRGLS